MNGTVLVLIVVGTLALAALLVVVWAVAVYNGLVTRRNRFKNAFAQIDVQLKRRYDLIPNLVETAKGYLKHERETLEAVLAARGAAVSAESKAAANPADGAAMRSLASAEGVLGASLGRLLMVVEAYPDLKADRTMAQLSEELTSTENKIAFARQAYNDSVMEFNTAREVFPSSLIAGTFAFEAAQPYELPADSAAREAPKVAFG